MGKVNTAIKGVIGSILDSVSKENIELFEKLIQEKPVKEIKDYQDFYFSLIYDYENVLEAFIKTKICNDNDVVFLLMRSRFIESHFEKMIEHKEGRVCCADKSRTIMKALIEFYRTGEKIQWNYKQEYTFHLPKEIFETHEKIITFYEGLKNLFYGNPTKYLEVMKEIINYKQGEKK